jgi:hypothetical protein
MFVTIPESVTTIGNDAFHLCETLTSVIIPNSVTTIGDSAFTYCSDLKSITIGNSVTTIGKDAFVECYFLKNVNYMGDKEQWNDILIHSGNDNLTQCEINYNA